MQWGSALIQIFTRFLTKLIHLICTFQIILALETYSTPVYSSTGIKSEKLICIPFRASPAFHSFPLDSPLAIPSDRTAEATPRSKRLDIPRIREASSCRGLLMETSRERVATDVALRIPPSHRKQWSRKLHANRSLWELCVVVELPPDSWVRE